jgi:hypothetical protein
MALGPFRLALTIFQFGLVGHLLGVELLPRLVDVVAAISLLCCGVSGIFPAGEIGYRL